LRRGLLGLRVVPLLRGLLVLRVVPLLRLGLIIQSARKASRGIGRRGLLGLRVVLGLRGIGLRVRIIQSARKASRGPTMSSGPLRARLALGRIPTLRARKGVSVAGDGAVRSILRPWRSPATPTVASDGLGVPPFSGSYIAHAVNRIIPYFRYY